MKVFLTSLFLLLAFQTSAQNFEDDFSDGDFTKNPGWSGADSNFVIFNLDGNNVLRLNDDEASTSYLSTPSSNIIGEWEFFVRIDGGAPSNNNRAEIYLMSDVADLDGAVNGYAIRIGRTGDDVFTLVRVDAGTQTTILQDTTIFQAGGEYRLKVSRDGSGNWAIEVGEGYSGELKDSGNTILDNTYTSSFFFGVWLSYTSTRTDDFYFDFKIDPPPVIIDPLRVSSFEVQNQFEVDIAFTREIDVSSVQLSDFMLNGATPPNTVSDLSNDTIRVAFNFPMPGGENELSISGIESVNNDTVLIDTTLTFFIFDEFLAGDVIINEFLKDPPPGSGLPEYIELRNTSSKYLNLNGWQVGDNSSLTGISSEDLVLLPDSFLVVTSDPDALTAKFGEGVYIDVSLPALNNTTDQIRVFDAEGNSIDSLEYTPDWSGVDVALERKAADVPGTFQANWGDSPSSNFGTPGFVNAIEPDEEAPFVISTTFVGDQTLQLLFSEAPTNESATNPENYVINPVVQVTEIRSKLDSVFIDVLNPFIDGQVYEITVSGIEDIFGNRLSEQVEMATYFEVLPAVLGDVVINEILYRRLNELSPEFVELVNPTEKNIDLSGWELIDAGNNDAEIPEGTFLPAGEYIVLTDREDFAASIENGVYLSDFPSLNDSGDELVIKDAEGTTMDSLFYDSDWGGNTPGVSLERRDPGAASNDPSNWGTSTAQGGFSAGSESSLFEVDVTAPEIIFSTQLDTVVKVVFSEFVSIVPETQFFVNALESRVIEFNPDQGNEMFLEWMQNAANSPGKVPTNVDVVIQNLEDIKGNRASEISSAIASRLYPGAIVINEIMFDPLADSDDNLPDQTEYVELYNPTNEALSLEGITIHDAPDEDNEIRTIEPFSSEFKWIPAGGYFLIYSEDEAESFTDSRIAQYFSLEGESDQFTMRVDRSSLSLASSGDAIYIADSTGATVDSVFYDESWHNPIVFDTDGIALERINPEGPSNDESNWSSSTDVSGGTPTMQNTIFQKPGSLPSSSGISFSPNPFSPDDDGFEDNLFINYTLDAPDYLLRVRIFDRYGREVRELADGVQAGFEGSLIWDGLTDDRRKNRVGIYIVLFEAYNSASGSDRTFKETVVLARMF